MFFYISSLGNGKCFKRNLQWANQNGSFVKGGICFLVTPPPCPPFFNGGAPQIINTNNNMSYYGVSLPPFIIEIKQNGIN